MYILKALLKALKRDFSSIIRSGLVHLQRILSFGIENCFFSGHARFQRCSSLTTSLPSFLHCVRSAAGGKAAGKKMNSFCFRLIVDNTTLNTSLTIMMMNTC